jgi:hypothetical protein
MQGSPERGAAPLFFSEGRLHQLVSLPTTNIPLQQPPIVW